MNAVSALIVTIISTWFAILVLRQFLQKGKDSHFFWFVSLVFSALASLAFLIALLTTPHSAFAFRVYYLLGAMWMPALMGLGSLALLLRRKTVWVVAGIVIAIGIIGSVVMEMAPIVQANLDNLNNNAGIGVITVGTWLALFMAVLNSFGALAVFLVALLSAWRRYRQKATGRFFLGNIWLALGILVISMAGYTAGKGWPQPFWIVMLIGWIITFIGYRMLTPRQPETPDVASVSS